MVAILLVSDESQAMLISQFGKIIRMGTDSIREAGRATQGVKLLQLEGEDQVAAAVVLPRGRDERQRRRAYAVGRINGWANRFARREKCFN